MREVVHGASTAFIMKVAAFGLGFGFNTLLARLLGAEGTGIYYLAFNVLNAAMVFGVLGLDTATLRFVASSAAQDNWVKVKGVYRHAVSLSALISVLLTLVILLTAPWIAEVIFSEPTLETPLRLMSLATTPFVLTFLIADALKGLKRIPNSMIVNGIGIPLSGLLFLAVLGKSFGVNGAVIAYLAATIVTATIGLWLWRQATPQTRGLKGEFDTRLLMTTTLPLFWLAALNLVMRSSDTTMLGIWMPSAQVGIYGIAKRVAALTGLALVAVNSIVAPKFAELYAQSKHRELNSLARNTMKLMTVFGSLLILPLISFPQFVLNFFGAEFVQGARVLQILVIGQFVNVATGSGGYLLLMSGHEKVQRNNAAFSTVLNVLLNAILIPHFGLIGAAIATAASLIVKNSITVFLVYRHLSIRMWFFAGG